MLLSDQEMLSLDDHGEHCTNQNILCSVTISRHKLSNSASLTEEDGSTIQIPSYSICSLWLNKLRCLMLASTNEILALYNHSDDCTMKEMLRGCMMDHWTCSECKKLQLRESTTSSNWMKSAHISKGHRRIGWVKKILQTLESEDGHQ